MKKFAVVLSVVVSVWVLSPTPQAHASWWGDFVSWLSGSYSRDGGDSGRNGHHAWSHHRSDTKPPARVPELDPSAAGGAMILLLGGVAYIASRRRKEDLG